MKRTNGDGSTHLTDCGLPGIGQVPYGLHLCHFYPNRQDLLDGLLAYFKAGLMQNERCIWVTAEPLPRAEAREEIARKHPEMIIALGNEQLTIVGAREWYGEAGSYVASDLVKLWTEAEKSALDAGHNGLRVAGNTSFLRPTDWDAFMAYEHALTPAMTGRRILALCSYSLEQCRPTDMLDVVRNHHVTLDCVDSRWQLQQDVLGLPRAGISPASQA